MISSVLNKNFYHNNVNFKAKLTVLNSAPKARTIDDEVLLKNADKYLDNGDFNSAITSYNKYLTQNPYDAEINLSIAKTYTYNEQYNLAIPHFERYLLTNSDDIENITMLGECYKKTGIYPKALEYFNKALAIEPNYDYAKRNILDTQNLQLAQVNPEQAQKERFDTAIDNLTKAVKIAKSYLPKGYTNEMRDVTVSFDKTSKMGGRSNIAQYEHRKRKISVTDEYTYADPKLVGAYLIHEFVHGKDNDPYTSIREEQDAYRIQAQYWLKNAKNIYDPEMDYVADLYKQSAKALDDRVEEIYRLRDPYISDVSFNHPPSIQTVKGSLTQKAGQPLREYDVIV